MSRPPTPETWKDVVRQALQELGGHGHLKEINQKVKNHPKTRTNPTWQDTIRRVVRQYSIFEPVPPQRSGVYRLVEEPPVEAKPQTVGEVGTFDHGVVQGMLLALGRLYGYETYAPVSDRVSKEFQGQRLADFATVSNCSGFCGRTTVRRVGQIDAIWLAEDNEGPYPVYAFEVEHTTKVRSGMDRLVEIPDRYKATLFVVAPGGEERELFDRLVLQNKFRRFRERMHFREYGELDSLYNAAVNHDTARSSFGVVPRRK